MAHLKIEVSVHPSFFACFIFPSGSAKPEDTQITLVKNRGSNLQAFALFTIFVVKFCQLTNSLNI